MGNIYGKLRRNTGPEAFEKDESKNHDHESPGQEPSHDGRRSV